MAGETRVGILLVAQDLASGNIAKVQNELRAMGPGGVVAAGGLGAVSRAAGVAGGALSHFKGVMGGLISGPLGFIGLSAGLFSVAGAIKAGIGKANEFGFAIEKLQGLTGDSADSLARLIAVTDNYGVSADRLVKVVGFTEKALGLVNAKADGAKKFAEAYGFAITDVHGKVLPFNTILLKAADFYNSNASQSQKAALAAKLFGRSYADLVPILKLGSQGIRDAEQQASDLGITLTASNVKDLAAYRAGLRELGDAVTGLQLQIGLHLVPVITELATGATRFIADNRAGIVAYLDHAIQVGRQFASFVTGTVIPTLQGAASVVLGVWNSVPGPLRDILAKGFVANKAVKFLFGIDVAGSLIDGIGKGVARGLATGMASSLVGAGIGKAFVQPVFVTNPGFGALGSLAGGAAAGAEGAAAGVAGGLGLAAIVTATLPVIAVGAVAGLALLVASQLNIGEVNKPNTNPPGSQGGPRTVAPRDIANPTGRRAPIPIADFGAPHPGYGGSEVFAQPVAALNAVSTSLSDLQISLRADFHSAVEAFRAAADPKALMAAAARIVADVRGGVGNAAQTKALVEELTARRDAARKAGDKSTADALTKAIRDIQGFVPGRQHQEALLARADKIAASSDSVKSKVADLERIENELKSVHRTTAASIVQKLIDEITATNALTAAVNAIPLNIQAHINVGKGPTVSDAGPSGPKPSPHGPPAHHRARGGPVDLAGDFVVGEEGPELLSKGRIIPLVGNLGRSAMRRRPIIPDSNDLATQRWDPSKGDKAEWLFTHGREATVGNFGRASMGQQINIHVSNTVAASDVHRATSYWRIVGGNRRVSINP